MFDQTIENLLRQAIARGEFDDLPNKGRPIDLSAYFATPEDRRVVYAILKNAGMLPREINLLNQLEQLRSELATCPEAERRRQLQKDIEAGTLKLNIILDHYRQQNR